MIQEYLEEMVILGFQVNKVKMDQLAIQAKKVKTALMALMVSLAEMGQLVILVNRVFVDILEKRV